MIFILIIVFAVVIGAVLGAVISHKKPIKSKNHPGYGDLSAPEPLSTS